MTWLHSREIYDRHDFYEWTRGKVAAGFFGGEREPLLQFADLCQKEFMEALQWDMCPTDEMLYSWLVHYHSNLFDPYVGEYGDCLRNQIKTRGALHLYMPFLHAAREHNNFPYVVQITKNLRRGYLDHEIVLPTHDIISVWYHAFIAYFELQQPDDCLKVIQEYIQLAKDSPEIAEQFQEKEQELIDKSAQLGHPTAEIESI
jgi:hypothetical protein